MVYISKTKMKIKEFLIITIITFISPLLTGYYYGVLDHSHYLPYLNKLLNPYLYPVDYYFSQPHGNYSLFNYIIVYLSKITHLNLAWTHFILYFLSLWLLYIAVYYLAKIIYQQSTIGFLAVFLFLLPKWAAQIGYMTHQFYFVSRDLSMGLSLLALSFILKQKFIVSLAMILLAAFINPSIPIPVGILYLWLWFKKQKASFSFAFFNLTQNKSWLEILRARGTYSFPHLWRWTGWGNLVLFLSLLGTAKMVLKDKLFPRHSFILKLFLKICTGLFIFHFIISAVIPVAGLIQIQLLRSINYVFIIALITFAATCNQLIVKGPRFIKLLTFSSLLGVYCWGDHLTIWHFISIWILPLALISWPKLTRLKSKKFSHLSLLITSILLLHLSIKLLIIKPQVFLPYYFHYPNPLVNIKDYTNWFAVQLWAKEKTLIGAVFLVPPDLQGFRNFSERSIVVDVKDGGLVFYSPEYARLWSEKMTALKQYDQFTTQDFINLKNKYFFQYIIVTAKHQPLGFEKVYGNQGFLVYKI